MQNTTTETIGFVQSLLSDVYVSVVQAIIVILLGFLLGRIIGRILYYILHNYIQLNKALKSIRLTVPAEEVISTTVSYGTYIVSILYGLHLLNLTQYVTLIIGWVILALIVLSLFLGLKDLMPNLMSGILLYRKGIFKPGKKIQVGKVSGKIVKLGTLTTIIELDKGEQLFIPNSKLAQELVRVS